MIDTTSKTLSEKLAPVLEGKVESYFVHRSYQGCEELKYGVAPWFTCDNTYIAPSYTACELMKVLPAKTSITKRVYPHRTIWEAHDEWDDTLCPLTWKHENPAEALGEMVLWLHGEGLL